MEIACSSWSVREEIPERLSLIQFPAWCGSRGFAGVEIADVQMPSRAPGYLTDLRRACEDAGVSLTCLATANDFTLPDNARRADEVDKLRRLLYDVAAPLEVPRVRVMMGMADTSNAGDERALEAFRWLVPDLELAGIMLVLENHARVQTPPEAMASIIAGVDSNLFGCCLDLGIEPAERRYHAIDVLAPLARYVHARSYAFDAQGEETQIDYKRALAILTESGYDGVFSVLYDGTGDLYEGTLATKALVEKHWFHPEAGYGERAA